MPTMNREADPFIHTHRVEITGGPSTMFVSHEDDERDRAIMAAAVGHRDLCERDVTVTVIGTGETFTFTAQECEEWWA